MALMKCRVLVVMLIMVLAAMPLAQASSALPAPQTEPAWAVALATPFVPPRT